MRVLFGIILGVFLTVAGAYLIDTMTGATDPGSAAASNRPMVNWDVVDQRWERLTSRVRREWDKLAAK